MNPDDIFNDAMAKFKQDQLDSGVTPEEYAEHMQKAIGFVVAEAFKHDKNILQLLRDDPEGFAQDVIDEYHAHKGGTSPEDETDPDGTVDLDDLDLGEGGDK